jgi:hypothetical protein
MVQTQTPLTGVGFRRGPVCGRGSRRWHPMQYVCTLGEKDESQEAE